MSKENEILWRFYDSFVRYMQACARYHNTSYKGDAAKAVLLAEGDLGDTLSALRPFAEKRGKKEAQI